MSTSVTSQTLTCFLLFCSIVFSLGLFCKKQDTTQCYIVGVCECVSVRERECVYMHVSQESRRKDGLERERKGNIQTRRCDVMFG